MCDVLTSIFDAELLDSAEGAPGGAVSGCKRAVPVGASADEDDEARLAKLERDRRVMTKTELNGFRRALETKRNELENGSGNREALAIDSSPEELDRIQNASNRDWAMGNLERNSSRLREVRAALRRIDAGAFGTCVDCKKNINPKRLAAVPWASSCIVCQEAADRDQKMPPGELDTSLSLAEKSLAA
jgi:DnaK suppressor protein